MSKANRAKALDRSVRRASQPKNYTRKGLARRTAGSFLRAGIWSAEQRNRTHPTKIQDVIIFRRHLLELVQWADSTVTRYLSEGSPRLMVVRFDDFLEAEIAMEALTRCFEWYRVAMPSVSVSVGGVS